MTGEAPAGARDDQGRPDATAANRHGFVLVIMMMAYLLNYLDRQIVNIVAEPLKHDLGLADWQLGFLSGTAFAVLYSIATIPIARLSDRHNRVWILAASVGLWSLCTAACGLAVRFWQILLVRLFVGLGEAGFAAPAQSLITEITPPERRARALGIYSLGVPLGALFGMALGGVVAQAWGWRWAFLLPGTLGVLVAVLIVVAVRDPRARAAAPQTAREPLLGVLGSLWRSRSFRNLTIAASFSAYVGFSTQAFFASFFLRSHEAAISAASAGTGPLAFIGIAIGLILGGGGLIGTYLGGVLADRAGARRTGGYLVVPAAAMAVLAPIMAATFLAPGLVEALGLMLMGAAFKSAWYAPTYAAANSLVPAHNRATATAVLLLVVNFVGLGLGPLVTGAISSWLTPALGMREALRWALVSVAVPSLLSGLFYWLASRDFASERVS